MHSKVVHAPLLPCDDTNGDYYSCDHHSDRGYAACNDCDNYILCVRRIRSGHKVRSTQEANASEIFTSNGGVVRPGVEVLRVGVELTVVLDVAWDVEVMSYADVAKVERNEFIALSAIKARHYVTSQ